jgi:hypothetical protein
MFEDNNSPASLLEFLTRAEQDLVRLECHFLKLEADVRQTQNSNLLSLKLQDKKETEDKIKEKREQILRSKKFLSDLDESLED